MNADLKLFVAALIVFLPVIAFAQCIGTTRLDANFALGNNDICEGGVVSVQNTTDEVDHENVIYVWDWGDGGVDTIFGQANASHVYTFPDTDACSVEGGFEIVEVRLDAILPDCPQFNHFVVKPVFVFYSPVAEFEAEEAFICLPELTTNFKNNTCAPDSGAVYTWNFNDIASGSDNFSDEFEPSHTFSGPGVYNVSLTVESSCGVNTSFQEVVVQESPTANATLPNVSTFCAPTSINLTNTSSDADEYRWSVSPSDGVNFFPGTDATTENAQLVFQETGLFEIQLEAINECAIDTFTFSQPIEVQRTPTVSLTPVEPSCEELIYQPVIEVDGEIDGIIWEVSGSQSFFSADLIPDDFVFPPGEYNVRVSVENRCGIASDTDSTVIVFDRPDVNLFPVNPQCSSGLPIELNFSSSDTSGVWSGNGVSDNGVFDPQGTGVVVGLNTLVYTAGVEGCQTMDTLEVDVRAAIEVEIGVDTAICFTEENFLLPSFPTGGVWNGDGIVNDGGIFSATDAGVGTHELVYEVFDNANACFASATRSVVIEALPTIDITQDTLFLCVNETNINLNESLNIDVEGNEGIGIWSGLGVTDSLTGGFNTLLVDSAGSNVAEVLFTYRTNSLGCEGSDVASVALRPLDTVEVQQDFAVCITDELVRLSASPSFGSWTSLSGQNQIDSRSGIIELESAGSYDYVFSIFGNTSCASRDTVTLEIVDMSLITNAGEDLAICEGSTENIQLTGFEPLNGVWTGEGIIDENEATVDLSLLEVGEYTLYYEAEDANLRGCRATDSLVLRVDGLPVVDFELQDSLICRDVPVGVDNLSDGASRFLWSSSDSLFSSATNPSFTFESDGLKTLQLLAFSESNENCIDSTSLSFSVLAPPASALFELSEQVVCVGTPVEFIDRSEGENLSYIWNYGNDSTSTSIDPPSMLYEQGERDTIYFPTLSVENACGALTYQDTINIFPRPIARFGTMLNQYCEGEPVEIRNVSVGLPTAYNWNYGNGVISSDSLPIFPVYSVEEDTLSYTIRLNIENGCGVDSISKMIQIVPSDVEAFFNIDELEFCVGDSIQLESFATPNVPIEWQFGDGNSTTVENPIYAYDESGVYVISQLAFGCGYDSLGIEIQVSDTPVASFEVEGGICLGDTLQFINTSTDALVNIWNFGDGQERITDTPIYAYQTAGNYVVQLTAENNICVSTFELPVSISELPSFELIIPDTACTNALTDLRVDVEEAYESYSWTLADTLLQGRKIAYTFTENGPFEIGVEVQNDRGCATTATTNMIVLPQPVASFAIDALDLCTPTEVAFINTSTNANTFEWKFEQGVVVPTTDANFTYLQEGDFTVDLVANLRNFCLDTVQQVVSIRETPQLDFQVMDISCGGANDGSVAILNLRDSFSYELFSSGYFQDDPLLFDNLRPDNYQLTVMADNGCDTTYQLRITEPTTLSVDILEDSIAIVEANPIQIDVDFAPAGLNFQWQPDNFVTAIDSNRFVIAPRETGYYVFEVNDGRCSAMDSIYFDVASRNEVYLPTAFSPNGDGENDRFFVQAGLGIGIVKLFQVFDRKGGLVYEATDIMPNDVLMGWDGTLNGDALNPGIFAYFVQVEYKDGTIQELVGDVALIR